MSYMQRKAEAARGTWLPRLLRADPAKLWLSLLPMLSVSTIHTLSFSNLGGETGFDGGDGSSAPT